MVSAAPVAAAEPFSTLEEQLRAFVATAKLKASDGLSVSEFAELLVAMMRIAIATVDSIPVDGAQRKAFVLNAVAFVFDTFADKCVPLVAWPAWILLKPAVRAIVMAASSGAIEALLPLVRSA